MSCLSQRDISKFVAVVFDDMPTLLGVESKPFTTFFTKVFFYFAVG